jgi:molybdenum cofactor cytidylyltransferase
MTIASIAAVVLAAGRGARFDARENKLLVDLAGAPLLRRAVDAALASGAGKTIVVTGHARADVERALDGLPVSFAHNADFAEGLASSLRVGLSAAGAVDGALVLLGDMPALRAQILDALIAAFEAAPEECPAVVPVRNGRLGNPVLLSRRIFPLVTKLAGDVGARGVLLALDSVVETPIDDDAILADVDTRADLSRLRHCECSEDIQKPPLGPG